VHPGVLLFHSSTSIANYLYICGYICVLTRFEIRFQRCNADIEFQERTIVRHKRNNASRIPAIKNSGNPTYWGQKPCFNGPVLAVIVFKRPGYRSVIKCGLRVVHFSIVIATAPFARQPIMITSAKLNRLALILARACKHTKHTHTHTHTNNTHTGKLNIHTQHTSTRIKCCQISTKII